MPKSTLTSNIVPRSADIIGTDGCARRGRLRKARTFEGSEVGTASAVDTKVSRKRGGSMVNDDPRTIGMSGRAYLYKKKREGSINFADAQPYAKDMAEHYSEFGRVNLV